MSGFKKIHSLFIYFWIWRDVQFVTGHTRQFTCVALEGRFAAFPLPERTTFHTEQTWPTSIPAPDREHSDDGGARALHVRWTPASPCSADVPAFSSTIFSSHTAPASASNHQPDNIFSLVLVSSPPFLTLAAKHDLKIACMRRPPWRAGGEVRERSTHQRVR